MTINKCVALLRESKKVARGAWKDKWLAELPGTGKIFLCSKKRVWATTTTVAEDKGKGCVSMPDFDPDEICVEYWVPEPASLAAADWKEV